MKVNPEIKEKIVTAANALAGEGNDNPTNDQVRERLGGGSLSHISPVMREWRESRKAEVVAALEMPGELKSAIESSVGQVWTTASKLASASAEAVRQKAAVAIEAAAAERDEALAEITRLEERVASLQKDLEGKERAVIQAQTELEQERDKIAKLTTENATLGARVADRDEQILGLKADLKDSRNDNKALQAELVEIARRQAKR